MPRRQWLSSACAAPRAVGAASPRSYLVVLLVVECGLHLAEQGALRGWVSKGRDHFIEVPSGTQAGGGEQVNDLKELENSWCTTCFPQKLNYLGQGRWGLETRREGLDWDSGDLVSVPDFATDF